MELSLSLDDVAFRQNKNLCKSRLDTDIRSEVIKGVVLDIPLIASNMSTVTNADFCIKLYKLGSLGVMHRAAPDDHLVSEITKIASQCEWTAASIGYDDFSLCDKLVKAGANIIVVDLAHGYSDHAIEYAKSIRMIYGDRIKLVLGNTINPQFIREVADIADAVRIGISQGNACSTKLTAGCTEGQFTAIQRCSAFGKQYGVPILSDGSTKIPADFVKAIAAGAAGTIAGRIFAACPESAADDVYDEKDNRYKVYSGMASKRTQYKWRGLKPGTCAEGRTIHLPVGEPAEKLLERYSGALRSGITYGGGTNIVELQERVEFIRITPAVRGH